MYVSELTAAEKLKQLAKTHTLSFVGRRTSDEPFTSFTGTTRSKSAIVMKTEQGVEVLLTAGEARQLIQLGVAVPEQAFKEPRPPKTKRGLGGLL